LNRNISLISLGELKRWENPWRAISRQKRHASFEDAYQISSISSSTIIRKQYLNEELPRSYHDLSTCGQSWDRRSHCTRRRSKSDDDDDDDDENEVSTALVTCVRKLKALWILCRLHRVVHITWVTEVTTCLFRFFLSLLLSNLLFRLSAFFGDPREN